jgi:hypothetical protein
MLERKLSWGNAEDTTPGLELELKNKRGAWNNFQMAKDDNMKLGTDSTRETPAYPRNRALERIVL